MHKASKLVGAAVLTDEDLKSNARLEVKLVAAGAIAGRLVDDDGLPVGGGTLHVWMSDSDRPPSLGFGMCLRRGGHHRRPGSLPGRGIRAGR